MRLIRPIFLILFFAACAARHNFTSRVAQPAAGLRASFLFSFDSDRLESPQDRELQRQAERLKEYPHVVLLLQGHTDSIGDAEYNLELGDRRARHVKVELVSHGISPDRLIVVSHGEASATAPNTTEQGRVQNRRVDVLIRQ